MSFRKLYALHDDAFTVFDISNPDDPTQVGQVTDVALNNARRVVSHGNTFAYVQIGGTLQVVDTSDPANPTLRGSVSTDVPGAWMLSNVAETENGLFIALCDNNSDVALVDISDPDNPTQVWHSDDFDFIEALLLHDDRLYVVDTDFSAGFVRTFAPLGATAVEGARFTGSGGSEFNAVLQTDGQGHFFIVEIWGNDFLVIDWSDPNNPVQIGSENLPASYGWARQGVYHEGYVYVVRDGDLDIWDVTDPENPSIITYTAEAFTDPATNLNAYDVRDGLLVARAGTNINVFDVETDPTAPILEGTVESFGGSATNLTDMAIAPAESMVLVPVGTPTHWDWQPIETVGAP